MTEQSDWYENQLNEYRNNGRRDAERGIFKPPYPHSDDDPQDEEANFYYKTGFDERRNELGADFRFRLGGDYD